jgi:hypothetical protein
LGIALLVSLASPNLSQGASLSGIVYVDLSGNGAFDSGEWGVNGALINLYLNNTLVKQTHSDIYGQYSFENLVDGTYSVRDTVICYQGNSADLGELLDQNDVLIPGDFGTPNSAMLQISGIALQDGQQAVNYNFGNDRYPMQLYSKYMLSGDPSRSVQPAVPTPEPSLMMSLLIISGMFGGYSLWRRRKA